MDPTIEDLPTTQLATGRAWRLRPSVREALWGLVFISPWLIGLLQRAGWRPGSPLLPLLFLGSPLLGGFLALRLTLRRRRARRARR